MKLLRLRSKRVAMRRQSLKRQNMRFDDVALLVDGLVVIVLGFAGFARWDDRFGASCIQPFAQGLTVIAFIRDEFGRRWHGLDATLCDLAVMYVSGRQEQDAGSTLLIWSLVLRPPLVRPIP